MIIYIPVDELEEEYRENWKLRKITHPCIDYATNSIHAWFEDNDVIIFKFKNYGFINDNRTNVYELSSGPAGITILIKKHHN